MTPKELNKEAKRIQSLFMKDTGTFWSIKAIKQQLKEYDAKRKTDATDTIQ